MLKVYEVMEDHMDKPLDWRDRLHLASDHFSFDLANIDSDVAADILEYVEWTETEIKRLTLFRDLADARFNDHGMMTMTERLKLYPEQCRELLEAKP